MSDAHTPDLRLEMQTRLIKDCTRCGEGADATGTTPARVGELAGELCQVCADFVGAALEGRPVYSQGVGKHRHRRAFHDDPKGHD